MHTSANEAYHLDIYKKLVFRHPSDKTVGYFESSILSPEDFKFDPEKPGSSHGLDDAELFDHKYLRYAQILDTDHENYIVMYSCQEGARYY